LEREAGRSPFLHCGAAQTCILTAKLFLYGFQYGAHASAVFPGKAMEAVMNKPIHHEHRSHSYERLERAEAWMGWAAVAVAFLVGAVIAIGLMTTTGHVTW
jgi:hypothetical protein